ncbi:anti-repressor SinI family protein [Bacillus sp. FJAT-49711]|nr:anti-repressor SinI family protein [Bacillus sp. FJAT-49711]MBS4218549.1 anti-repressor SinI family protein [Bacillus sp. FJAT-49711]
MLDQEWTVLILQAKHLGLTTKEVREFLKEKLELQRKIVCGQ